MLGCAALQPSLSRLIDVERSPFRRVHAVFNLVLGLDQPRCGGFLCVTRRLDNQAYLQALEPTGGPVAVAHVFYPFRANENDAWFLVNGVPPLIDVDDQRNLPLAEMRSSAAFAEIHQHYPNVTFWPGGRGRSGPEMSPDGRQIVVGYLLRDLCHACAIVGRVRYGFDFSANGRFIGARLVSITPTGQ
ncbi:MAG: hypothetical protein WB611_29880 [Stellaceae bacterium]